MSRILLPNRRLTLIASQTLIILQVNARSAAAMCGERLSMIITRGAQFGSIWLPAAAVQRQRWHGRRAYRGARRAGRFIRWSWNVRQLTPPDRMDWLVSGAPAGR